MGSGNCVSEEKFEQGRYSDLDPNDYALITLYTFDVGMVDTDGGGFRSLSVRMVRAPDWAPDGIVYQSFDGIQIMSTEGGDSRVILTTCSSRWIKTRIGRTGVSSFSVPAPATGKSGQPTPMVRI